jgi:hypothetical protein
MDMSRPRNRNYKIVPGAEPAIDALKYEIAKNLGLQDTIDKYGWTRLTTIDAGNVGGAIQQIINELGQRQLIQYYKEGRISEITHLSPDAQPEKYDLTRTRLLNTDTNQSEEFQRAHNTDPGNPRVEPDQITPNFH